VACLLVAGCARDNGALQTAFNRFWGFAPDAVATAVREAPRSAADSVDRLVERVKPGDEAWAADPFLADNPAGHLADAQPTDARAEGVQTASIGDPAASGAGPSPAAAGVENTASLAPTDTVGDGAVVLVQNPPVVNEISSSDASVDAAAESETGAGENPFARLQPSEQPSDSSPLVQLKDTLDNEAQDPAASRPHISPVVARAEIDRLMLACRQEMRRGEFAIALRVALVAEQLAESVGVYFGPDEEQPGDVVVQLRERLAFEAVMKKSETPGDIPQDGSEATPIDDGEPAADVVASGSDAQDAADQQSKPSTTPAVPQASVAQTPVPQTPVKATELEAGWVPLIGPIDPLPLDEPAAEPRELPILPPGATASIPTATGPIEQTPAVPVGNEAEIVGPATVSGPEAVVVMPTLPQRSATDARLAVRDDFASAATDTPAALLSPPADLEAEPTADAAPVLLPPGPARVTANQSVSLESSEHGPLPSPGIAATEPSPVSTQSGPPVTLQRQDAFAVVTATSPVMPLIAPPPLSEDGLTDPANVVLDSPADTDGGAEHTDAPHDPPPVPDLAWGDETEAVNKQEPEQSSWLLPAFAGAAIVLLTLLAVRRR
jgi:hypothetical protein